MSHNYHHKILHMKAGSLHSNRHSIYSHILHCNRLSTYQCNCFRKMTYTQMSIQYYMMNILDSYLIHCKNLNNQNNRLIQMIQNKNLSKLMSSVLCSRSNSHFLYN